MNRVVADFKAEATGNQQIRLKDLRGKNVVLYFYPKDETPGCTTEACEFRDNIFAFRELNAQILGISLDDVEFEARRRDRESDVTCTIRRGHIWAREL